MVYSDSIVLSNLSTNDNFKDLQASYGYKEPKKIKRKKSIVKYKKINVFALTKTNKKQQKTPRLFSTHSSKYGRIKKGKTFIYWKRRKIVKKSRKK